VTSLDRTPAGTDSSVRVYAWATIVTTLATLATVLALALTGNENAAVAVAAAGSLGVVGGAVQITVHIRR
jgi:nitrate/nitrite-specific signal transduction histidine kinase